MHKDELLAKIYSKIDEIATLPVVIPKLLAMIDKETTSHADLTEVISRDPALTAKILKVANSAYYGFSQEITSLKNAIALLGLKMVKSLAVSIGVMNSLPSDEREGLLSQKDLWIHSLAVATVMNELNNRFRKGNEDDHLFIVGLLHDIGKIVLDQFFNKQFQQALKETRSQEKAKLHVAECEIVGLDHSEVGAMLLSRWKFPKIIINPIIVHHKIETPEGTRACDAAMLRIADVLPQECELGDGGNPLPPEIIEEDMKLLGMEGKDLEEIKDFLINQKDEIYSFFNSMN